MSPDITVPPAPSPSVDDGPDEGPYLAVAVDAERLSAGIVDERGSVVVRDRVTTPTREVWRTLEGLVGRVLAARPDDIGPSVAAGVCCAGPVDHSSGAVWPPFVPAWTGFPLRSHLEDLTGLPTAIDSTAGAYVEAQRWLADDLPDDYALVVCDAVVGSACVLGGRRLRGLHGNAGSIAHITVDPVGLECWCGARGCLAPYASAAALEAELSRPLRTASPSIADRTGIMLGRAIAALASMVDVTTVRVTGVVVDVLGQPMLESVRREMELRSRLPNLAELEVVPFTRTIRTLTAAAAVARSIALA